MTDSLSALSRNSSIFSREANIPQLLQRKFLLLESNFKSPPHSGQKFAKRTLRVKILIKALCGKRDYSIRLLTILK
ncbi:MAG: hypothetical protein WA220_09155, partial [Candidatus Nitrosopolaris sp.]